MRLVSFSKENSMSLGVIVGEQVVDLQFACQAQQGNVASYLRSMLDLIEGGETALELARSLIVDAPTQAVFAMDEIKIHAPLARPPRLRDFVTFEEHYQQAPIGMAEVLRKYTNHTVPKPPANAGKRPALKLSPQPFYYKGNTCATSGPDDDIIWPQQSKVMDYELELGAVIGKRGKNVGIDSANEYIFGYTIFNDFSARDLQGVEMMLGFGPGKSKDFDGANAFGPCIVTADEIPDPHDLKMVARINGEEWSRGNSGDMVWTFEDLIVHCSQDETLQPGEILGSGTVGAGCGLELGRFLEHNDVVELEIEHIGILRNKVIRK